MQPTIRSGADLAGRGELLERLLADHGLVHQHVVEHAAQRVPGVGAAAGRLDRLADRDAQAARRVRVDGEHVRARLGGPGRAGVHGGAPGLHHRAPVRLLVVGGADHPDLAVDAVLRAGEGQRAAPLPGAGLGGEPLGALGRVVVRLRDGGVRLVRPGRRHALVLVVDPRRGVQRLLQPVRPVQRGGPPQPVDVEHLVRDVDEGVGGHFLADQLHREQRREVLRAHRLARARVQRRGRRRGQVRDHVVPLAGDLGLIQCDLGALGHNSLPISISDIFPNLRRGTPPDPPAGAPPPCLGDPLAGRPRACPGQPTRVLTAALSSAMAFFASAKNMLVLGSKYSSFSIRRSPSPSSA